MANGPALYLGRVGSTGTSTGPHAHWQVRKDGKLIPLSTARTDIGQYIQFRRPNQTDWTSLYTKGQDGQFSLAPEVQVPQGNSAFGMREKHPVHGDRRMHWGEDYGFEEGTQLRFLGPGSVATHAGRGAAGNVSSLRLPTGYELETLHLSELPQAATTSKSDASNLPVTTSAQDTLTAYRQGLVDALGLTSGEEKEEKKVSLTDSLLSGVLANAFQGNPFMRNYMQQNPYMQGRSQSTADFLSGLFG